MVSLFATFWIWMSMSVTHAAPTSVGGNLDTALAVDVTAEGLDQLGPVVETLIPNPVEPGDISQTFVSVLTVNVTNLMIDVQVDSVRIVPRSGAIDFDIDATLSVNEQNNPAIADINGATCNFFLQPFEVTAATTAFLALDDDPDGVDFDRDGQPDTKRFDVTFGPIEISDTAMGSDVQTPNCVLGSVNAVLALLGIDVFDLLLDAVRPQLVSFVEDLPAQVEPLLEEPVQGFGIAEEINLLGIPFYVALWPETLVTNSDGVRIGFASFVDVPASDCVADYDIDTYAASTAALPGPPYPSSPITRPHAVGFVDDDFANLSLYSAWAGGLLCLDLNDPDNTFQLPFAIDNTLLAALAPDGTYDHLFEEPTPISVVTDPKAPPFVDLTGPDDASMVIDPIGLVLEAEVAGRRARILDVEVTGTLGANLEFDGTDGAIALDLAEITEDRIDVAIVHNDFAPETNEAVRAGVSLLLEDVAAPLLDDQLAGITLAVDVPAIEGFGLQSLEVAAAATDQSVLGAYTLVGPVPYEGAGCTDGGGCDQGCASSGSPHGAMFGVLLALGLVLRRRTEG